MRGSNVRREAAEEGSSRLLDEVALVERNAELSW